LLGADIYIAPTYGNTLMGLAASDMPTAADDYKIAYYGPQPRAVEIGRLLRLREQVPVAGIQIKGEVKVRVGEGGFGHVRGDGWPTVCGGADCLERAVSDFTRFWEKGRTLKR